MKNSYEVKKITSYLMKLKYQDPERQIIAYKCVKDNFMSPIFGRIKYTPGRQIRVKNWDSSNKQCSSGLNVATEITCQSWIGYSGKIVRVRFRAKDIVAVPPNGHKIRVRRLKVLEEVKC